MSARSFSLASWLLLITGCVCGAGAESHEYFCTTSAQCQAGFHCDFATSVCVIDGNGGGAGGGQGGDAGTGGGSDAGSDAGEDAGADAGADAGFDAGGVRGARCIISADCINNSCVDGYCCASSCGSACDFCDLPGQEGQCTIGPLGRRPSPGCGQNLACDGTSVSCPTACTSDAGCVASRCGQGGVCVEKLVALKDDFNSGSFNPAIWDSANATCTVVNSAYRVVTVPGLTSFVGIHAARRYDFLDSELRIDLIDMGNQSLASMQAFGLLCSYVDPQRCLELIVIRGSVFIQLDDTASYSVAIGYFPMNGPRPLRMREQAGTLFLDAQTDAGVWQALGSKPTPYRALFNDVSVNIGAGTYAPEPSASTVIWDNVNLP